MTTERTSRSSVFPEPVSLGADECPSCGVSISYSFWPGVEGLEGNEASFC